MWCVTWTVQNQSITKLYAWWQHIQYTYTTCININKIISQEKLVFVLNKAKDYLYLLTIHLILFSFFYFIIIPFRSIWLLSYIHKYNTLCEIILYNVYFFIQNSAISLYNNNNNPLSLFTCALAMVFNVCISVYIMYIKCVFGLLFFFSSIIK